MNNRNAIQILGIISLSIIFVGCAKSTDSPRDFEKLMGVSLPTKCTVEHAENAGKEGAIVVVHISKDGFPAFSNSLTGYSQWYAITNQMDFKAVGKTFHAPTDLRGEYTVGKKVGGIARVLIWDENSETLTGILATGMM